MVGTMKRTMRVVGVVVWALVVFEAEAWMEAWAPAFECTPAKIRNVPLTSVSNFVCRVRGEDVTSYWQYCHGGALDLNGDRIDDYVFILPWMGCGLCAFGDTAHFLVSDGKGGRMETVMDGYGIEMSDLVEVGGKTYFRHSMFFEAFEKSKHNHWAFQVFAFDTNGVMRCANAEVGCPFPAVTIFYENPKFRPVELTPADLKEIEKETRPDSHRYVP